jgi:hypothetical protein
VKGTADDPRAVRRLAKTLIDHQSDAMLPMTASYQIAHNGTYALHGSLKRTAHIAGYALPVLDVWWRRREISVLEPA